MKFNGFFESLVGSRAKARLIHYLLRNELPASEREIARRLGLSHTAVNKALKEFFDLNLVHPLRVGNVNAWRLNKKSYAFGLLSRLRPDGSGFVDPLEELKGEIANFLGNMAKEAFLFGSVSEGNETPESDIDVLVVAQKGVGKKIVTEKLEELSSRTLEKYGNILNATVFREKEISEKTSSAALYLAAVKGIRII